MKWHSCAEYGCKHHLVGYIAARGYTQRSSDVHFVVGECLADFVCHYLSYAFEISTEAHPVGLAFD